MPLVIITGRPCSGKSTFARALVAAATARGADVTLVSEEALGGGESFGGDRARSFASAASEKISRARLKAAVERALTHPRAVVVADGGSGVKGFRYELHVLARNARTPSACAWVGPDVPLCAALTVNAARGGGGQDCGSGLGRSAENIRVEPNGAESAGAGSAGDALSALASSASNAVSSVPLDPTAVTPYGEPSLRDLWARYEAPDARNKWDSPLVRVPLLTAVGARVSTLLLAAAAGVQFASAAAGAAAAGQVPPGGDEGGDACTAWWASQGADGTSTDAAAALAAAASSGPLLTSRFALSAVYTSGALAEAARSRGTAGGAVAEQVGTGGRRAARQHADAAAWLGAVPLEGFSARSAQARSQGAAAVASLLREPDYFAPGFNADPSPADDDGADDVGDLSDFAPWGALHAEGPAAGGEGGEALEAGGAGVGGSGAAPRREEVSQLLPAPLPDTAARSSFRRAPRAAAAPPALTRDGAAEDAAAALPPLPPTTSAGAALEWLVAFCCQCDDAAKARGVC